MKNISRVLIAVLLVTVIGMTAAFATESKMVDIKPSKFRNGEKFGLYYDTFLKQYFICQDSPYDGNRKLYMDDIEFETFTLSVKKAAAWRQIAIDNNAEVDKDIPNAAFSTTYKTTYYASGRHCVEKGLADIFLHFKARGKTSEFTIYCPKYDVAGSVQFNAPAFNKMIFKDDDITALADSLDYETLNKKMRKLMNLPVDGDPDLTEGFESTGQGETTSTKKSADSLFV